MQVLDTNGVDKLKDVIGVASGLHHSVALKKDGTVVTWGYNAHGQLGLGDKVQRSYAEKVKGVGGKDYLSRNKKD